jgi:hypothetical protein
MFVCLLGTCGGSLKLIFGLEVNLEEHSKIKPNGNNYL